MKHILILVAILATIGAVHAGELYRWVDKNGVVHYGDSPQAEDAERIKIHVQSEETPASGVAADIPYEARMAAKHFPVTLYVFVGCDELCKQAHAYLDKRKVPYTEHVIRTEKAFEEFKKSSGMDALPVLTVGRKWLRGFDSATWGNELDAAGYPK
jgi:glutaredoxin